MPDELGTSTSAVSPELGELQQAGGALAVLQLHGGASTPEVGRGSGAGDRGNAAESDTGAGQQRRRPDTGAG
jgi:hypothetical protein